MEYLSKEIWTHCIEFLKLKELCTLSTCSKSIQKISLQSIQSLHWSLWKTHPKNSTTITRYLPHSPSSMKWFVTHLSSLSSLRRLVYHYEKKNKKFYDDLFPLFLQHFSSYSLDSSYPSLPFQLVHLDLYYTGHHPGLLHLLDSQQNTLQSFHFSTNNIQTLQCMSTPNLFLSFPHLHTFHFDIFEIQYEEGEYEHGNYKETLLEVLYPIFSMFACSGSLLHFSLTCYWQVVAVTALSILQHYQNSLFTLDLYGLKEDNSAINAITTFTCPLFPRLQRFRLSGNDLENCTATTSPNFLPFFILPSLQTLLLDRISCSLFQRLSEHCPFLLHLEIGSMMVHNDVVVPGDFFYFLSHTRVHFLHTLKVPFSIWRYHPFPPSSSFSFSHLQTLSVFDQCILPLDIPVMQQLGNYVRDWKVSEFDWNVSYEIRKELCPPFLHYHEWRDMLLSQGFSTFPKYYHRFSMSEPLSLSQWMFWNPPSSKEECREIREWKVWIRFPQIWSVISFLQQWHHSLEHFTIYYLSVENENELDDSLFETYLFRLMYFIKVFLSVPQSFPKLKTLRIIMNADNRNTHPHFGAEYEDWEKQINKKCPSLRDLEIGWVHE
uniref:F-box domain-containing protein n=1 Tax=viral metagenome TaxID=1070528 RepID=A0A6C0D011_9ZZZZ